MTTTLLLISMLIARWIGFRHNHSSGLKRRSATRFVSSVIASFAMLAVVSSPRLADAQIYNASTDFSATQNPNGTWSYGWSQTNGSAFNLLPNHTIIQGTGLVSGNPVDLNVWTSNCCGGLQPLVAHNPANEPVVSQTADVRNDSDNLLSYSALALHPGPNGQNAIVRWMAPKTATYSVSAIFAGLDRVGTTTNVAVFRRSGNATTQLFAGNVVGYVGWWCGTELPEPSCSWASPAQQFTELIKVNAGDSLDFAVGDGPDGNYAYDTTGLTAIITPLADLGVDFSTPIPGSLAPYGLSYAAHVFNFGPDDASNVILTIVAPLYSGATTTQGTCQTLGSNLTAKTMTLQCNLGTTPTGSQVDVAISTTIYPRLYPHGFFVLNSSATISASTYDPNAANNTATLSSPVY